MATAKRGGKRTGAGRKPGSPSRATRAQKATLSELARAHTATALATLVKVMRTGESDASKVAAANSILDRGYGKPRQSVEHSGAGGGPIQMVDLTKLSDEQLAALEPVLAALASESGEDQA